LSGKRLSGKVTVRETTAHLYTHHRQLLLLLSSKVDTHLPSPQGRGWSRWQWLFTYWYGLPARKRARHSKYVDHKLQRWVSQTYHGPAALCLQRLTVVPLTTRDDIGRSWRFFYTPPAFDVPLEGSPSEYYHNVWCGKLERL